MPHLALISEAAPWALDFFSTAVAAWFGAWAAFRLESGRERERAEEEKRRALRGVLFALYCQLNHLTKIDREHLAIWRADPVRAYRLPPSSDHAPVPPVDFGSLLFLFGSHATLIEQAQLADTRFHVFVGALRERSEHRMALMHRLEADGIVPGVQVTLESIRKVAGPSLSAKLEQGTDAVYNIYDLALDASREAYDAFDKYWRLTFPKFPIPKLRVSE